jgi:hypothetical protein
MSNSPTLLVEAASAVAALGVCQRDIDALDEASLVAGMGLLRALDRQAQAYKLWFAAAIARQSDHTLGYDGLARRNGSATPATFMQSMTGSSLEEVTKLARLAQSIVDAERAGEVETPIANAAVSGAISVDAADAIQRGLGAPDSAVTAAQLGAVAGELIARAGTLTPEELLQAARQARNDLDLDAIERGEKQRSMMRYVRLWHRDGMFGGSWALPDEDGGLEVGNALKLLVAKKTNGPRFADVSKHPAQTPDVTESALVDDRTPEQMMADGFAQIFHNGLAADPSVVPGAGRAAVRVIVPAKVLEDRAANGPDVEPTGSALLEESMSAVSFSKLEEYLCEGGTFSFTFDANGQVVDAGREARLFTKTQRSALGIRDGGCRVPGCNKPASWCEAHHINFWSRDTGRTDIANGILLCRYHHMLIHNKGWQIIRDSNGRYWLKRPQENDPQQTLVAMTSKNPLVEAMTYARQADQALAR